MTASKNDFESLYQAIVENKDKNEKTLVFTGAGVSTLSGIKDFRGKGGLYSTPWHGYSVEDILSLREFLKNPKIFYAWAREFCYCLDRFSPNIVHKLLAKLEGNGYISGVVTQNIDILHQAAGSLRVCEFHGSPAGHHCLKCHETYGYDTIAPIVMKGDVPHCSECNGIIKPDIVFYGEGIDEDVIESSFDWAQKCTLCIVLGSSLTVQPAAAVPIYAAEHGAKLCIVNAQATHADHLATWKFDDLRSFAEKLIARFENDGIHLFSHETQTK